MPESVKHGARKVASGGVCRQRGLARLCGRSSLANGARTVLTDYGSLFAQDNNEYLKIASQ